MSEHGAITSEQESRDVAEAARQASWEGKSVLKEIFLGNFHFDWIHPFPVAKNDRPEFVEFCTKFAHFLDTKVDPVKIDQTGEYPAEVLDGLRALGAFGMKIPKKYGGLGFSQSEYCRALEIVGARDANVSAVLSAHQSIGVPSPLKIFGTEEQKQKWLPRCAKGAISAFALTEKHVGSDPAGLSTTFQATPDGEGYIINGEKLWCTNGTIAELLVVMARHPETKKISAFVVETNQPGVTVVHRCRFMGLKALANAVLRFDNVRVGKDALIGKEGAGLKIALVTLNTGRLSLPAGVVGGTRAVLEVCRKWVKERMQWGVPIYKHEAIALKVADMASTLFAMEAVSHLCNDLADRPGYDIRLEASAAKEWNSTRGWRTLDDALQIRGGRGYETESSLIARGEGTDPFERMMRDSRINLIFEGSSEIMHLFMAREAVDTHLQVAGDFIDPRKSLGDKLKALVRMTAFYGWWYPTRWLGWSLWPKYGQYGRLATHLRFIERTARRLARQTFHGMLVHQAKLERKQGFLFRIVDIGMELFAMAAAVSSAHTRLQSGDADGQHAIELADVRCSASRRLIEQWFGALWANDDAAKVALTKSIVDGNDTWLEEFAWVEKTRASGETPRQAAAAE